MQKLNAYKRREQKRRIILYEWVFYLVYENQKYINYKFLIYIINKNIKTGFSFSKFKIYKI